MQVDASAKQDNKVVLSITLSPEEVDSAIDSTYKKLVQRMRVPGFRPGKAPKALLMRTYGDDAFYHQATDEALRRWYPIAVSQSGIEPVDEGEVDLVDEHPHVNPGEEFGFSATVTVKPEVELPEYHEIKIPAPSTTVRDPDVDKVIESIRASRATLAPAPAKAAEIGDVVKMNIHGRADGEEVLARDDFNFELIDESEETDSQFPGLSKELVGSRPGDIRDINLTLPADHREQLLAGKVLVLQIVVKEIQRKVLPDLTDEFAKDVSAAPTVSDLRAMIRHNLEHEKHEEATSKVATEVIDSMIARSNLQPPEVMITDEQDRMLREHQQYFERQGLKFEQVLMISKKSEDEYRDELRPRAERSVKRDLILDAVAEAEKVQVDPAEVEGRIQETVAALGASERDAERLAGSNRLRRNIEEELRRRLALEKLVELTSGLTPLHHEGDGEPHSDNTEPEAAPEPEAALAAEAETAE